MGSSQNENYANQLELVSVSHDITQQTDMNLVPLAEVINKIRKGIYKIPVRKIREFAAKGDAEMVAKLKKNLPYFVLSIIKGNRRAENVSQANGIVFDFDHVKDIEAFKKLAATKIPGAKYVFRSPNDGVKVLVQFSRAVTEKKLYKFIWDALAQEAENLLGVKPDATADMCRACFVSYDADLISTHNEPLDVEMFRQGCGDRGRGVPITGHPSLRTVRAVLPHTALQKTGISFKRLA